MKDQLTKIKLRDWTETRAHSSWQVFKIMAEFVQGFEAMAKIGPCISIFGSARTKPGHKYYELTVEIARRLAEEGFVLSPAVVPALWKPEIRERTRQVAEA